MMEEEKVDNGKDNIEKVDNGKDNIEKVDNGKDNIDSAPSRFFEAEPYTVFGDDIPKIESDPDENNIVFEKEGYFSIVRRKVRRVVKNITIEPVMLFLSFVGNMDSVSMGQLLIDKSCEADFDFPNGTCDPGVLLDGNHTDENIAVQNEITQFNVYVSIVDHMFPIIVSFFLGSWSDTFGRKFLLYLYFITRVVEGGLLLLNVWFMSWPKEFMLFTVNLPVALVGGHLAFYMGINAFIADISPPHSRSFRMAMVSLARSIGNPVGTKIGIYLYDKGGYMCVFSATLLGRVIGAILLIVRLEMFNWKPIKPAENPAERKSAFSLLHIKDSFSAAFKKREHHKRFYLISYLSIILMICVSFFGEFVMSYNYVRTRYNWGPMEYGNYRAVSETVDIVGQSILIPLLGYLAINDSIILPFILTTILTRHILKGFAVSPWMLYLASGVDLMGGYSFSACRSFISKCVDSNELGKIFALVSSLESLVPMVIQQVYASLWKATGHLGDPWVGSCFFLSASLVTPPLILSLVVLVRLKGAAISDLGASPPVQPSYKLNKDETLFDCKEKTTDKTVKESRVGVIRQRSVTETNLDDK